MAEALVDRVATDAPIAVVVLVLVVGGLLWIIHSMHRSQIEERKRHETTVEAATGRFITSIEKNAAATEQLTAALVSLRSANSEIAEDLETLGGEMRSAISDNKTTLTEIRAAAQEARDALRNRGTGR